MRRFALLLGLSLPAACSTGPSAEEQIDRAREVIRPSVTQVIAKEYPGTSVTPLTTCVLENLTDEEVGALAQASLQGISGRDTQMIRGVVRRPETRTCAFDAGVTGFF